MTKTASSRGQRPAASELRASIVWPIAISVGIWIVALVIWLIFPGRFDALLSLVVAIGLVIYLLHLLRRRSMTASEIMVTLLLSVPAVLGIAVGMIRGQALYTITGVSLSLLLLAMQRAMAVPFSYRMARRSFVRGQLETSLDLADRAIEGRPDFWETYQLRALIYLSDMQFGAAERDARQALALRPDAHPVYNTLGQIYLAEAKYDKARDAYAQAHDMSPKTATYAFYLGLADYRLGAYGLAAESLAAATRLGLPDDAFELQAYYYLGRALSYIGETEKSAEVLAKLPTFKEGIPDLESQIKGQPDFPGLAVLKTDLADIKRHLRAAEKASA